MNLRKKGIIGAVLFALVSAMPLWAIWEGNAGIAGASEFPGSGYFAKSDMFPRNTIVEIVNLETDITIRAVITGSSGVPGLVALLSPDAAAALNVKTGSVSRVRISVPSPVAETPASGTLSGGSGTKTEDPDVNPESAALEADRLAGIAEPAQDPLVALDETPEENPEVVPETPVEDIVPEADTVATADVTVPELTESPEAMASMMEAPAESLGSGIEDVPEAAEPVVSGPLAEALPETTEALTSVPEALPSVPDAVESATSSAMFDEPELTVPDAVAVPNETPEIAAVTPGEPIVAPEALEQVPEATETVPEMSEAVPETPEEMPEVSDAVPEATENTETVVTLEPAEMLPPPVTVEEPGETALAVETPVETAPVAVEPTVAEPVEITSSVDSSPASALPLISAFEAGKYYVQIASYTDAANVMKIIASWGGKYPISVERAAVKDKTLLKVYVGPVNRDEYGAVLERFKAAGFRDAFVKKGS